IRDTTGTFCVVISAKPLIQKQNLKHSISRRGAPNGANAPDRKGAFRALSADRTRLAPSRRSTPLVWGREEENEGRPGAQLHREAERWLRGLFEIVNEQSIAPCLWLSFETRRCATLLRMRTEPAAATGQTSSHLLPPVQHSDLILRSSSEATRLEGWPQAMTPCRLTQPTELFDGTSAQPDAQTC